MPRNTPEFILKSGEGAFTTTGHTEAEMVPIRAELARLVDALKAFLAEPAFAAVTEPVTIHFLQTAFLVTEDGERAYATQKDADGNEKSVPIPGLPEFDTALRVLETTNATLEEIVGKQMRNRPAFQGFPFVVHDDAREHLVFNAFIFGLAGDNITPRMPGDFTPRAAIIAREWIEAVVKAVTSALPVPITIAIHSKVVYEGLLGLSKKTTFADPTPPTVAPAVLGEHFLGTYFHPSYHAKFKEDRAHYEKAIAADHKDIFDARLRSAARATAASCLANAVAKLTVAR